MNSIGPSPRLHVGGTACRHSHHRRFVGLLLPAFRPLAKAARTNCLAVYLQADSAWGTFNYHAVYNQLTINGTTGTRGVIDFRGAPRGSNSEAVELVGWSHSLY